jgi:hypothetical protein
MTPEQRARLAEGRAASRQRWLAGRYLTALGAETRTVLSRERVITRPESDAALRYRLFDERGLGLDEVTRPPGYQFFAFSRPEEVLAQVEAFGVAADEATGDFCPTYFVACQDGEWLPSGELPVFEVRFGWARTHFPELYAAALHGCNLTTRCGRAGLLTRVVCGYQDRHADESVFELACWGGASEAEPLYGL